MIFGFSIPPDNHSFMWKVSRATYECIINIFMRSCALCMTGSLSEILKDFNEINNNKITL